MAVNKKRSQRTDHGRDAGTQKAAPSASARAVSSSVLGDNPLSQGIFRKTETSPESKQASHDPSPVSSASEAKSKEYRVKKQESRFLEKGEREAVNLRLPLELNDWLNELLRQGKRRHGSKIPKEIWVQAALELFQALPVDWEEIEDESSLRETLKIIESRNKNLDYLD